VRVFPVAGSTLCRGLGWWEDSLGRFPRLEGLITYGEPHKSHLNGVPGSRRGILRRGFSRLLLFFFVLSSSSDGDWNRIGFLFLSRSLDLLLSMSSEEPFKQCKELWMIYNKTILPQIHTVANTINVTYVWCAMGRLHIPVHVIPSNINTTYSFPVFWLAVFSMAWHTLYIYSVQCMIFSVKYIKIQII